MKHQERAERAAQQTDPRNVELSTSLALWQIAHSLAVIADALEDSPIPEEGQ